MVRSWLLFRMTTRMDRAAVVVQSIWRGRMVRVRAGKMLVEMRARIAAAKAAVQEHMKLGNRTRAALASLMSSSSVTVCLKAISALEVASEHSIVCAIQIVQQGAIPVIYRVLGQCNRSITSKELPKHAVRTLANLCNPSTYASRFLADVWTGVDCVACLADTAVAASENPEVFEPIVKVLCTLLAADSRLQMIAKHAETQQKLKLAASTLERRQKRVLGNASTLNVKADGQKMIKRTGAAAERMAALVAKLKQ
jgi:abnormal spindle-like microcephaly-associated protein